MMWLEAGAVMKRTKLLTLYNFVVCNFLFCQHVCDICFLCILGICGMLCSESEQAVSFAWVISMMM